ncbi:hypothetical protein [Ehrlichia japonica]|uniref:Uncharacterized protein n=1 Tax=Ehrlichia japonica TaxID=391036 RepID=X5H3T4_9RICK|nr:hypothetical protein [Ehrlichia japonica]AHX04740.1 hypothetical protein EHF_0345 [Ehrlichia japonica]
MNGPKLYLTDLHLKLKNSLFCGFKGWLTLNLAGITLLNLSLYNVFHGKHMSNYQKAILKDSQRKTLHQMKKHLIPFFEVMIVMPAVFLTTHYLGQYFGIQSTELKTYLICLAACMSIMIIICLSLRILGIRKDCCGAIEHPIYRNTVVHNNDYVNFKGPKSTEDIEKYSIEHDTTELSIMRAILSSMLMSPLILLKAAIELTLCAIEILELPFSFILDMCTLLYNTITHSTTSKGLVHSKKNLHQMTSFLYAGARDLVVACSFGILDAKILKQNDGTVKSPISCFDEIFTRCTTLKESKSVIPSSSLETLETLEKLEVRRII